MNSLPNWVKTLPSISETNSLRFPTRYKRKMNKTRWRLKVYQYILNDKHSFHSKCQSLNIHINGKFYDKEYCKHVHIP